MLKRNLVMLIDDEADIISLFTELLETYGIGVRAFSNPEESLKEFRHNHESYNLVISDIRMKPMSGIESIKKVEEIDSYIKTILITAIKIEGNTLKEINC